MMQQLPTNEPDTLTTKQLGTVLRRNNARAQQAFHKEIQMAINKIMATVLQSGKSDLEQQRATQPPEWEKQKEESASRAERCNGHRWECNITLTVDTGLPYGDGAEPKQ